MVIEKNINCAIMKAVIEIVKGGEIDEYGREDGQGAYRRHWVAAGYGGGQRQAGCVGKQDGFLRKQDGFFGKQNGFGGDRGERAEGQRGEPKW